MGGYGEDDNTNDDVDADGVIKAWTIVLSSTETIIIQQYNVTTADNINPNGCRGVTVMVVDVCIRLDVVLFILGGVNPW